MTRQQILKEKEIISHRILESIQEKQDINQLTNLLARQAWLSSAIKEDERSNSDNIS